jgi:hypothetical protein
LQSTRPAGRVAELGSLGHMWQALPFLIVSMLTGCVGPSNRHVCESAQLIEHGAAGIELRFCHRYWGGFLGPHGYVGYQTTSFGAALEGVGPTFTNPRFQDNPADFQCVGSITLDREHNRVVIAMWRVISVPGKPDRRNAHPANGTYGIESVRKAMPDEDQWFRQWLAKSKKTDE